MHYEEFPAGDRLYEDSSPESVEISLCGLAQDVASRGSPGKRR
jgi:hypothetical protein